MNLDCFSMLEKSMKDADYVLVGLGEEWIISYDEMLQESTQHTDFSQLFELVLHHDCFSSLIPFFERLYYKDYIPEKWQKAYENLRKLLSGTDYFVVSLAMDSNLTKTGFDVAKVVQPCGNYNYLQCASCKTELLPADEMLHDVDRLVQEYIADIDQKSQAQAIAFLHTLQDKMKKITCPTCTNSLEFNQITASCYNEAGYLEQWDAYMKWLSKTVNKKLCLIEAGVGMKFPSVIRWPFEKTTLYNQKASFYRIHHSFNQINKEIADRSYGCKMHAVDLFAQCEVKVDE